MTAAPLPAPDRNAPYLAILIAKGPFGHEHVHAGLACHGFGRTLCSDRPLFEFQLPARDPNFALSRNAGWRHRYAEAFLEQNRGCQACLDILGKLGREAGYATPKSLKRAA